MQIISNKIQSKNNAGFATFRSMKKSQFHGMDFYVVERFKLPIEKFNTHGDFQIFCQNVVNKIQSVDLKGRSGNTESIRQSILSKWYDCISKNNLRNSTVLMILKGITGDLTAENDNMPPILNESVLNRTLQNIEILLGKNPKAQFNFQKAYQKNMRETFLRNSSNLDSSKTGWIVIPSKIADRVNYEENLVKMMTLSYKTWCTREYNAEKYLNYGGFHIYMKNGNPVIGVRFLGNLISEIQGTKNNQHIPLEYFDIINEYISHFRLSDYAKEQLLHASEAKTKADKIIAEHFPKGIRNYSTKEILEVFGIKCKEKNDGKLIISHYKQPDSDLDFSALGINENDFFKDIVEIEGNATFYNSNATTLGNLEKIGGNANFQCADLMSFGKLKEIGGNAVFLCLRIDNTGDLEVIGGDANFQLSDIAKIKIKKIGGNVYLKKSKLSDLSNVAVYGSVYKDVINEDCLL